MWRILRATVRKPSPDMGQGGGPSTFFAMPTDKRERQRAGRESRRQAAREAQRKAARRRQVISIIVLLAIVVGVGLAISATGSDDAGAKKVAAGSSTTTAEDGADPAADPADLGPEGATPCPPTDGSGAPQKKFDGRPKMCLKDGASYTADVETDVGTFTIEFLKDKAPQTVNSFVFLARYRAYENVPFHRVIPDFVVQGGDVESGTGTGGPGYEYADELPKAGEYEVGSVAMANSGPNTNGSQFFVVTGPQGAALPPSYSLFGKVTSGLDVVKKIEADGSASGTPTVVHKIVKVTINEKG